MKNILIYLSAATFLLAACVDDFLTTDSPSKQTNENTYTNLSLTDAAIMGIYSSMTESYVYGQKITTNWPTNSDIEFAGLSEDTYNSTSRDAGASNFYAVADNQNLKWDKIYRVVELAAAAVDGIRESPLLETEKSTMEAYLGEALTLRALSYFELVKHFGDIPFKAESSNSDLSNVYIGKVDRDTVYKYIIEDLLEAEQYVPWVGNSAGSASYSSVERVTKGFIKGLAARVALHAGGWSARDRNQFPDTKAEVHPDIPEMNGYFTGRTPDWKRYYEIAVQQCAEILGSSENPHGLDDFENIWKTVCQLQLNSANENLFEIAFGLGNSGDIGNLIGMRLDANTKYGTISLGGGNVVTSAYYFYSFDQEDSRRDVTLTNINYSSDNKEKFNTNPNDWKFCKWRIYWMTDAYKALHKEASTGRVSTGINWIVMRYSDIYLMFAEAQNELYGADEVNATAGMSARMALETVRRRAFPDNPAKVTSYASDFFEAIVHERAWEFGGEALRKYDLIRWGLLSKKIEEQKVAQCLMFDRKSPVTIFDKTYQPSDFPTKIYYKYDATGEFIDRNSINYYRSLSDSPSDEYSNTDWLAIKSQVTWTLRVLLASTGLNASYDYSALIAPMDSANSIQNQLLQYTMGNGVCNNRHPFSIYSKEIVDSRGLLKNSYGY